MRATHLYMLAFLGLLATTARGGFDPSSKKNFVIYWGQSNGLGEKELIEYCRNDDYNIIMVYILYRIRHHNNKHTHGTVSLSLFFY